MHSTGGLGAFLVGLTVGETAVLKIKAPRLFHGLLYHPNRWTHLGFVAGPPDPIMVITNARC